MADGDNNQVPIPPDLQLAQGGQPPPTPGTGLPVSTPQPVPRMGGKPLIVDYIQKMIQGGQAQANPNAAQPARPPSRGDMTLDFMGQFLSNLSQGLAAAGHGPGANLRGAAGAMQAPYQRELQAYQLQQQQQEQQAKVGEQQAQTGLIGAQTTESQLNQELLRRRIAATSSGTGQDAIKQLGDLSDDEKALLGSAQQQAAISGSQLPMLQAVEKITSNRAISSRMGGNATVVPDTSSKTGYSKVIRNRAGDVIDTQKDALPPPGLLPTTTTSSKGTVIKDAQGNETIVQVPSSSTSKKVLPGGGTATGGTTTPKSKAAGTPTSNAIAKPILNQDGTPLHQPMGQTAKNSLFKIDSALSLADRVKPDLESVTADLKRGGNLWDSVQQRSAWEQYQKLGIDPSNVDPNSIVSQMPNVDPRLARLMPTIAMLQIVGAQPYLQGVRRFEFIKQIQSHLPDPSKDTPQLMVSKLQQLNRNLPALEAALYKSEGITPKMDGAMAQRYISMAGGNKDKARVMARTDGWNF